MPLWFFISKGNETIICAAFLFSDSEWSCVFRRNASLGLLMGVGPSHVVLELQHCGGCGPSNLDPSVHQQLYKIGWRDLQVGWLWLGSWLTCLLSVQSKAQSLEQGWVIQYLDILSLYLITWILDGYWLQNYLSLLDLCYSVHGF